jgi:steroid delta-isomerase-like uncharacterized protein
MKKPIAIAGTLFLAAVCLLALAACATKEAAMDREQLEDFATRYAAAWSGGDPEAWAEFYAEDATFRINEGGTARGRAAIAAVAGGYMEAFPDMRIDLERLVPTEDGAEFHWRWTGTNTGPGGSGRPVDMTGYEEWTFSADGLIQAMQGHFDEAEYARQMGASPEGDR